MIESDADRLVMIQAVGEPFTTGMTILWGVMDREYLEVDGAYQRSATRRTVLQIRTSDVERHQLVKDSKITRADGTTFYVKDIEDDGTGMTVLALKA